VGLRPITDEVDLLALDSYVRYLPMNFEPRPTPPAPLAAPLRP
jgi:hypothetical protein